MNRDEEGQCCDSIGFCVNACDPVFRGFCLTDPQEDPAGCSLGTTTEDEAGFNQIVAFRGVGAWPVSNLSQIASETGLNVLLGPANSDHTR